VPDLAAAGAADHLDLAGAVRREVVVEHERLGRLARHVDAVDALLVVGGAEGHGHQRLRLAAGEERRAVRARQEAGLDADRPDRVGVPTVHPLALVEDLGPHDAVLHFLDLVADVAPLVGELHQQLLDDRRLDLGDALGTAGLVLGVDGLGHGLLGRSSTRL
jgi:hypothetical protein